MSISITNELLDTVQIQYLLLDYIKYYDDDIEVSGVTKKVSLISLTEKGREKVLKLRAVIKK